MIKERKAEHLTSSGEERKIRGEREKREEGEREKRKERKKEERRERSERRGRERRERGETAGTESGERTLCSSSLKHSSEKGRLRASGKPSGLHVSSWCE